jgi:hypothetical protein
MMKEEELQIPTEEIQTDYSPNENKDARWAFDNERQAWELKAHLYGGWLTEDKNRTFKIKYPKGMIAAFMNSTGIENTVAIYRGFVTKYGGTSWYKDEKRIMFMCKLLHRELAKMYYLHRKDYGLSLDKASLVIRLVRFEFENNMRRSVSAQGLKGALGTERVVETHNIQSQPRRSFL